MKYHSLYSDRLNKAIKRIEELEHENAGLRKQLLDIQVAGRVPCSKSSTVAPTPKPPTLHHHYAQPTKSSVSRARAQSQQPRDDDREKPRGISNANGTYIYKDCVPILIAGKEALEYGGWPTFANPTKASGVRKNWTLFDKYRREETIDLRRQLPLRPHRRAPITTKGWDESENWNSSEETPVETPVGEHLLQSPPPSPAFIELPPSEASNSESEGDSDADNNTSVSSLAQRSRVDDDLDCGQMRMCIESTIGFQSLRQGMILVQESIYEASRNGLLKNNSMFNEGPHLVRLGHKEINLWATSLNEYNGHQSWQLRETFYGAIDMRNAVCHPRLEELQDPTKVDYMLQKAQGIPIILGDETRAMEIRTVRDSLQDTTSRIREELRDIYGRVSQPFWEEIEYQPIHEVIIQHFKQSLKWTYETDPSWDEIMTLVGAWNIQKE